MKVVRRRVLRVGLREQRGCFNSLVEFARDMSEKGCRDFEPLPLAYTVAQMVGPLQIIIAELQVTKIAVRSSELDVSQGEFAVELNRPFERRD